MASFNQVVLMGNLARDPELRYTPQGTAVANFTVAVNRRFTKQSGEKVEEVAFVDVTVWQRLAEITAEYLKKGRAVHLVGHLVQDRWEDPESGQKRSKLRVTAQQVVFLGKGSQDDDPAAGDDSPAEEALPPAPAPAPARSSAARPERRVRRA